MDKPTLAFFGATGGCTLACLAPALQAGYNCIAFRSPPKLITLLTSRGISPSTISRHLTLIEGSADDPESVKKTLTPSHLPPISMILSGVGGHPSFANPLRPKFIGGTICQDTVRTILSALRETIEQRGGVKPALVCISTTGISQTRDIPLVMVPLYSWVLKEPHADKRVMEGLVLEEMVRGETERVIGDYVFVRPSFLTNGPAEPGKVRASREVGREKLGYCGRAAADGSGEAAIGYTISREDVGGFMFGSLVQGLLGGKEEGKGKGFFGGVVMLTH